MTSERTYALPVVCVAFCVLPAVIFLLILAATGAFE